MPGMALGPCRKSGAAGVRKKERGFRDSKRRGPPMMHDFEWRAARLFCMVLAGYVHEVD